MKETLARHKPRRCGRWAIGGDRGDHVAATEEERRRFGRKLRELRQRRGMTAQQLGDSLAEAVSHQNITGWERGEYPPRRRAVVMELESILDAPGELTELLGYATDESALEAIEARFNALESRLARLEDQIVRLARRRRGGPE